MEKQAGDAKEVLNEHALSKLYGCTIKVDQYGKDRIGVSVEKA